ncbi:hypothetical protein BDR26DRAFT_861239 [Obelidium mucronatum]|nr:hypothetical protein BDR26DRAFT_861239 [Obelidium mucronatum]
MTIVNPYFVGIPHPLHRSFNSFDEFYPFYLGEHHNRTSRRLHFLGTTLAIGVSTTAIVYGRPELLIGVPIAGYSFAWLGHFAFEKNSPATFRYPVWSLMGDFRLYFEILTRQRSF